MVRLLQGLWKLTMKECGGFNPTMVRLLPQCPHSECVGNYKFQSHNGAIAASRTEATLRNQLEFQSHNGAIAAFSRLRRLCSAAVVSIPQWCDCCFTSSKLARIVSISFNPTMVRLLRGALGAGLVAKVCFNPTMVRLLPWRVFFYG